MKIDRKHWQLVTSKTSSKKRLSVTLRVFLPLSFEKWLKPHPKFSSPLNNRKLSKLLTKQRTKQI